MYPDDAYRLAGIETTVFGWIEIVVAAGFVGLFFLSFLTFARVFPGALPSSEELAGGR